MFGKRKKGRKDKADAVTDREIMSEIRPAGGISFRDPRIVMTGTGYEAAITVTAYPGSGLTDHWMSTLMNIRGTIGLVTMTTEDSAEIQLNIAKSMKEQNLRYAETGDTAAQTDAMARFKELKELYDQLALMGEVIKTIQCKIYVSDRTYDGLEKKVEDIQTSLEASGYECCILLNETKQDFLAPFQSSTVQKETRTFPLEGAPLQSSALAAGDPFHFSSLEDPHGDYIGSTPCGGNVVFDQFHVTNFRTQYNGVVVGNMGTGKSTWLKKCLVSRAARGDFVRVFDVTGEFTPLVKSLGGKVIHMDGSDGILNPLEILVSGDSDELSYMRHVSKVETIYRFLAGGECDKMEIQVLDEILEAFYRDHGLGRDAKLTGLTPDQYPTCSDLMEAIREEKDRLATTDSSLEGRNELTRGRINIVQRIESVFLQTVNNFASVFDGHTSITNISDEQVVCFDMSAVKEMKPEVFDAQIFNIVSFCWDNCVTSGKIMKDRFEAGEDPGDLTRFLILIDESHRWLNANKLFAVEQIQVYMREARKFFGGIILASQSIRDYVPGDADDAKASAMKILFELAQYKWIFRQDSNAAPLLSNIFSGVLTETQLKSIKDLEKGECFLCTGEENIRMKVFLTEPERRLFAGGL